MTKQPDIENVISAADLLREQLHETKIRLHNCIVRAVQAEEYDRAEVLIETSKALDKFISQVDLLIEELTDVLDPTKVFCPIPCPPRGAISLVLKNKYCNAKARYESGSVIVLRGSIVAIKEFESLPDSCQKLRDKLKRRGELTPDESKHGLVMSIDYEFKSPSAAACFVVGYSVNGKLVWIVENTGKSLGEELESRRT